MNHEDFEFLLYFVFAKDIDIPEEARNRAEQVMLSSELFTDRDYTDEVII